MRCKLATSRSSIVYFKKGGFIDDESSGFLGQFLYFVQFVIAPTLTIMDEPPTARGIDHPRPEPGGKPLAIVRIGFAQCRQLLRDLVLRLPRRLDRGKIGLYKWEPPRMSATGIKTAGNGRLDFTLV